MKVVCFVSKLPICEQFVDLFELIAVLMKNPLIKELSEEALQIFSNIHSDKARVNQVLMAGSSS